MSRRVVLRVLRVPVRLAKKAVKELLFLWEQADGTFGTIARMLAILYIGLAAYWLLSALSSLLQRR
jgi:hypothetical protein